MIRLEQSATPVAGVGVAREADGAGRTGGPGRAPRAGRNLPAAFAVGGSLAAVVLLSLLLWRPAFLAVVVAAVCVGTWEMVRAVRGAGADRRVRGAAADPPLIPLLAGGVAIPVATWFGGLPALGLGLLGTVLAILVWRLAGGPDGYLRDTGAGALIAVYVPFLAGFAVLLAAGTDGHWRILLMLVVVVLSDTGGYVAGVIVGRHPMAPTISPKKSWEGLAGSLTAAAAGGAVGLPLLFGQAWWWGVLFGLVVSVASVCGDLVESSLKRDLGVKDMSGLLPGHGGMLDRVDSILFAAPTAFLLLVPLAG